MNKAKGLIIGTILSFLIILIPVAVIGAIVEHPINFLGEIVFGAGDTTNVSKEVEEMYKEFLKSENGKKILAYINEKNEDKEKIYSSIYYTFPLLLITDEKEDTTNFEFKDKIDILFQLRYENEDDNDYIRKLKQNDAFNKISTLSDTTLLMYLNHFNQSIAGDSEYEVSGDSEAGNAIARTALTKLGCPYYWGAAGDDYFDCSGFVYWVFKQNGYSYGRTTAEVLSTMGKSVSRENLQAGDIITFTTVPNEVSHVGIYIGNGKMVHASGEGSTCLGNHASLGHVVKVATIFGSNYWESVTYNYRRLY